MSTSYGRVEVEFPGFKAAIFSTTNGKMSFHRLRGRNFMFADGSHRRLSRRERSSLRTLMKKWHMLTRYDSKSYRTIRPFRTFSEDDYC